MRDPYVYEGTTVLQNHRDIRHQKALESYEHSASVKRLAELSQSPIQGNFDYKHVRDIHAYIFQDVYPFAGQQRTTPTQKPEQVLAGGIFVYPEPGEIEAQANAALHALRNTDWSPMRDLSNPKTVESFATAIADLWYAHPFREGNTRTTVTFMNQFAEAHGFRFSNDLPSALNFLS